MTESGLAKRERNKKILGNKGELLILNLLRQKYGRENVFPVSEAFVELKELAPGQAVSANCDIEYINKETTERYFVEVKAGNSNGFDISFSELKFAKEQGDHYELYVVYNFEKEIPNYHKIANKFWEDSNYRTEEVVERIHVTF